MKRKENATRKKDFENMKSTKTLKQFILNEDNLLVEMGSGGRQHV